MPPRFAYWTILIDNKATAFRAQKQEELLPTFKQLSRANPNIVMRWFERGRLWDSPEQAQWARTNAPKQRDRRGPEWRPGGQNKDPRARFDKRKPRPPAAHQDARTKRADDQRSGSPPASAPKFNRPPRPEGRPSNKFGDRRTGGYGGAKPRYGSKPAGFGGSSERGSQGSGYRGPRADGDRGPKAFNNRSPKRFGDRGPKGPGHRKPWAPKDRDTKPAASGDERPRTRREREPRTPKDKGPGTKD